MQRVPRQPRPSILDRVRSNFFTWPLKKTSRIMFIGLVLGLIASPIMSAIDDQVSDVPALLGIPLALVASAGLLLLAVGMIGTIIHSHVAVLRRQPADGAIVFLLLDYFPRLL